MKKLTLFLLLGVLVNSLAWAQAVKVDVQKGVEKDIESDCAEAALGAFLQAGNKPVGNIAGFHLTQVLCSTGGATLVYRKSEHEISLSLTDNQATKKNGLAEMQLQTQKLNIKTYEDNIRIFEELRIKHPEAAAKLEKSDPAPGRLSMPSGVLFFKRQLCEDECGVVKANAMTGAGRYYFDVFAEHDGATRTQQAAENFLKEIVQTVRWDRLK